MTRLEYIATAYLAGDLEAVESALAWMPRPSTLAAPEIHEPESDVARGKLVLVFSDPFTLANIRAHIRATFLSGLNARAVVRVTGRNRHGARDWLAERLPGILDAPHAQYTAGNPVPLNLPPELQ